jgi:outer membrane protease
MVKIRIEYTKTVKGACTMRKIFFILFLLGINGGLPAEDPSNYSLSLNGSIGLLYGQSEEIVYRDEKTGDKLSQLLWDLKPLVYAGVEGKFRWQRPGSAWSIFADALFKAGIPGKTGVMEDRDWIALDYPQWLTLYSVHDNKTERAFLIDARSGVSFRFFREFLLKPSIAYHFMSFSWAARGGSFLYPSSYGDHAYQLSPDTVISYEQTWHILSGGIAFYGAFNRYFDIELSLALSPLIWSRSVDNHILRNLVVTDKLNGGIFAEGGLRFSFTPMDSFALSLSAAYRHISGPRGNSTYDYKDTGQRLIYKDVGGAGYSALTGEITARFIIF